MVGKEVEDILPLSDIDPALISFFPRSVRLFEAA
jgi:hypothetical protein